MRNRVCRATMKTRVHPTRRYVCVCVSCIHLNRSSVACWAALAVGAKVAPQGSEDAACVALFRRPTSEVGEQPSRRPVVTVAAQSRVRFPFRRESIIVKFSCKIEED